MARSAKEVTARNARMQRLAETIEALADKDERILGRARGIADLRRAAAAAL